jgi:hypothetical protein
MSTGLPEILRIGCVWCRSSLEAFCLSALIVTVLCSCRRRPLRFSVSRRSGVLCGLCGARHPRALGRLRGDRDLASSRPLRPWRFSFLSVLCGLRGFRLSALFCGLCGARHAGAPDHLRGDRDLASSRPLRPWRFSSLSVLCGLRGFRLSALFCGLRGARHAGAPATSAVIVTWPVFAPFAPLAVFVSQRSLRPPAVSASRHSFAAFAVLVTPVHPTTSAVIVTLAVSAPSAAFAIIVPQRSLRPPRFPCSSAFSAASAVFVSRRSLAAFAALVTPVLSAASAAPHALRRCRILPGCPTG